MEPNRTATDYPAESVFPKFASRGLAPGFLCSRRIDLFFADPTRVETIEAFEKELPVAVDLEAWLDAVEATGPPLCAGFRYMLRSNKSEYRSRLIFLQPFDPDKTPVVLIHGLMSTPRMWKPVLDGLLADRRFANITSFGSFITRLDSLFRSPLCSSGKR
jgi:hypothetical protein